MLSSKPGQAIIIALVTLLNLVVVRADIFDVVNDVSLDDPLNYFWNIRNPIINTVDELCMSPSPTGYASGSCKNFVDCRLAGGVSFGRGTCNFLSSCCLFQRSCGRTTRAKYSTFVNPQANTDVPSSCRYQVQMMNSNVCQLRIDIETNLAEPGVYPVDPDDPNKIGDCAYDSITIDGYQKEKVPVICGRNRKQHMYIPVKSNQKSVNINVLLHSRKDDSKNLPPPSWTLQVTQLECPGKQALITHGDKNQAAQDFSKLAPDGCLQYFTEPSGEFKSFNYEGERINKYLNNQDYAICFKRGTDTCGVSLDPNEQFGLEEGAGECVDYLYIPQLTEPKICMLDSDVPVWQSIHTGPLYVNFFSNEVTVQAPNPLRGFKIKYSLVNC